MSITDELRKWAKDNTTQGVVLTTYPPQHAVRGVLETLLRIADRIDAEHERKVADTRNDALYHANEKDMAELGWIRLPKDRDGEYIHIGDVMAYADNTKPMEVVALVPPAVFLTEDGPRYADMCHHYHAPTVEDVLREFANEVYADADNEIRDRDFLCAKYAKRLKLAEGEGE